MASKIRVASNDDQLSEFLFGSVRPWWDKQPWFRRLFVIPLKSVDKSYARWSKARVSPRRFRKIQERLDREYPPEKFSPANLIGRDKEFNILMDSFRLHVLRHPMLAKYFGRDELPKAICLAGDSGTGKTFLTMVTLRQMLLEGYRAGVLVTPVILKGSDVYSEFYGKTREMLLAVVEDSIKREAWLGLKAEDLLDLMEREVTMRRRASLTPSDIQEIFREVRKSKEAPLREKFRDNRNLSASIERPKISVKIDDFVAAARNIKLYSEQEKSQEVTDAVYVSKPKVNREDVGGLHDVKNKILNHIALAFNPSMAELGHQSNPRFFLMGPPGTGKTLLAMVAAAENNVGFIKVRGGELMSGANYMGDPEKRVKDLFSLVRQKSPCILLLDEADAIFWGGDPSSNKILAQVKAELSELRPEDKVVVIATSNKEQLIDQATRDRFEPNIYYLHPPQNDSEWNEVVGIHLKKFSRYLHPEVDAGKITKMFRRQRILSPRGAAETVSEAHRMWASEVAAAREVTQAKGQETSLQAVTLKYQDDLDRLDQLLAIYKNEGSELTPDQVNQDNYKIRLFHFQRAISSLESLEDKEHREIAEALILTQAIPGVTYGLYTSDRGSGGILTSQCTVRPINPGAT